MLMGKEQEQRLMGLLGKLAARDAGEPTPNITELMSKRLDFNGQEHDDARTLTHMGWIRSRRGFSDVANSWSQEGIYAFDLTGDGRAVLETWNSSRSDETESSSDNQGQRSGARTIMMIHGSSDGLVPQVVEDIRLWCFDHGVHAYKAADFPNAGRPVSDKVNSVINEADYYIVVLTPDEELTTGEFRSRPNTMIEMGRVLNTDPKSVCVLKDDKVEMPSDYSNYIVEPLNDWRSVLQKELGAAGLL